jgi:hypothetical protein
VVISPHDKVPIPSAEGLCLVQLSGGVDFGDCSIAFPTCWLELLQMNWNWKARTFASDYNSFKCMPYEMIHLRECNDRRRDNAS